MSSFYSNKLDKPYHFTNPNSKHPSRITSILIAHVTICKLLILTKKTSFIPPTTPLKQKEKYHSKSTKSVTKLVCIECYSFSF